MLSNIKFENLSILAEKYSFSGVSIESITSDNVFFQEK